MTELSHRITIDAAPENVWNVLTNLEAVAHYNPGVVNAHYLSPTKQGIGAARQCQLKNGSIVKERVIALEQTKSITLELYESEWPVQNMQWTTRLHASGQQTLVTQTLTYTPKGLIGRIINTFVMKRAINKSVEAVFKSLKTYVENTPAQTTSRIKGTTDAS